MKKQTVIIENVDHLSVEVKFMVPLTPEERLQVVAQINNAVKVVFGTDVRLYSNNNFVLRYEPTNH